MRFSFTVILTALAACASVSASEACTAKGQKCYPKHNTCCPGFKCSCWFNSLKNFGTVLRLPPTGGLAASQ
ncbi:hypothetical protein CY34DRAFT_807963 [Suillus luteus UH-Slu-Lm8-n1]|uniref:Uncharacterized protein n=1 Tax=Suillus luteus UH-Slu-Lm8-n1 TaxID=930992 RepID=A0A0D0B791_9AGAM|nr:hypothetical protein CY34DRAFT_807963 [Suillus luteus UH-Slu-Lm8-n1]